LLLFCIKFSYQWSVIPIFIYLQVLDMEWKVLNFFFLKCFNNNYSWIILSNVTGHVHSFIILKKNVITNLIVVVYIFIIIILHTFPWQSCIEYVLNLICNIGLMFHNKNLDEFLDHEFILCIIFKKITFDECKHLIVFTIYMVLMNFILVGSYSPSFAYSS